MYYLVKWSENGRNFTTDCDTFEEAYDEMNSLPTQAVNARIEGPFEE